MNKNNSIQSFMAIAVLSMVICWKIVHNPSGALLDFIADSLLVVILLGFGETIIFTLTSGSVRLISYAVRSIKTKP